MHAIEKILARNAGLPSVKTGEIVTAKVDFAEINDLYLQTVRPLPHHQDCVQPQ